MAEELKRLILKMIKKEGPITFATFMGLCLYHSRYGYYGSGRARIGRMGDYFTAPCVHPLFGYLLGHQLLEMYEIMGAMPFTVLEMGAGRGFLCADINQWAERESPRFFRDLRYLVVETSPSFLAELKEILPSEGNNCKVKTTSLKRLKEEGFSFEGCILANEFVDALPFHRLIVEGGEIREIYVGEKNGEFSEVYDRPSNRRLEDYVAHLPFGLPEGKVIEVNLRAADWLEEVAFLLKRGFVLVMDYGAEAGNLMANGQKGGTLRCYFRHEVSNNPYIRLGEQDITASVDFTYLMRKAEEIGLKVVGLVPQNRFLMALGFLAEMEKISQGLSPQEALELRLTLKHLIEPERGMGEIFKVLILSKGMAPTQLKGLRKWREIPYGTV